MKHDKLIHTETFLVSRVTTVTRAGRLVSRATIQKPTPVADLPLPILETLAVVVRAAIDTAQTKQVKADRAWRRRRLPSDARLTRAEQSPLERALDRALAPLKINFGGTEKLRTV